MTAALDLQLPSDALDLTRHYVDGEWRDALEGRPHAAINPTTEAACATVRLGGPADVDRAVAAARRAFPHWSSLSKDARLEALQRFMNAFLSRMGDLADAMTMEMGAPVWLARSAQAPAGLGHIASTMNALREFEFEAPFAGHAVRHEPVGVAALITPWNWPVNQIVAKVAPALAAGCTMVLKPSENAPVNAHILAEILHAAALPPGVFNLVDGDGPGVGAALASHHGVDIVSFTGSTRAGADVARNAAATIKRLSLELGGKSPFIVLDDCDLDQAVPEAVNAVMTNSGQSCHAPTRLLAPRRMLAAVAERAKVVAEGLTVGDPTREENRLGPLANKAQFDRVRAMIEAGVDGGATLATGSASRFLDVGYFVRPTVFTDVRPDMRIAQEEIFGPVLSILAYDDEDDAVRIANDTPFGLAAYVYSADPERARAIGRRIRAGMVHLNRTVPDLNLPFGGYKQSGIGREWGRYGLLEFLETKALVG